jgi:hypothetical protein
MQCGRCPRCPLGCKVLLLMAVSSLTHCQQSCLEAMWGSGSCPFLLNLSLLGMVASSRFVSVCVCGGGVPRHPHMYSRGCCWTPMPQSGPPEAVFRGHVYTLWQSFPC